MQVVRRQAQFPDVKAGFDYSKSGAAIFRRFFLGRLFVATCALSFASSIHPKAGLVQRFHLAPVASLRMVTLVCGHL